ncbi:putative drug exporter of the RND superfamily [Streptomyces sp. Ncost-T6T-1]|uniref:MMPL family transporter n=1 Tax=Streptomyces sp. Ncost-T6T-1 TaxID=1100828 RepID=UPI0008058DD3|nr:MMPL family transporter [Streptomyces sp. Ncost-T6T-1]SBV04593.1 putative drug exporter of the RND superfamily [Streptomyces sp. Ncost-T6T-1]
MATLLYKLGRFAFRRRGIVVLLWLLALGGAAFAASTAPAPPADTFSMPGTESQKAFDLLKEKFPAASADGASARVVVRAPENSKISDTGPRKEVAALVADLSKAPEVVRVSDPFAGGAVSQDGTTAYAVVTYDVAAGEVSDRAHDALLKAAADARADGLTVEMGGDAVPLDQALGGTAELIGIGVSAVILVLTFGSLVAAGMPLITALVGVGIGISAIGALGSTLGLSSTTTTLAMMIGLAVGIDYALFIVSRYRAEMAEGWDRKEAAGRAVGTAGSAVVFAGLTVIVALAGLAVVNVPMLTKMGLTAAGTVAIAVLVAVTLVPALLGFAPHRVLPRRDRKRIAGKPLSARQRRKEEKRAALPRPNLGARWAMVVLRRPAAVLLLGVLGLGAVAVPATKLELGLPGEGTMALETTQRKAYDMLSESFGPGFNGPLLVTIEADGAKAVADEVVGELTDRPGIAQVGSPTPNEAGDTAIVNVVPETGPSEGKTEELVKTLRGDLHDLGGADGAEVLVSGQTAMFIDFSGTLNDALVPYLAIVVGLAFALLILVFRSLLVPLKAALGFLLSVSAALGVVVVIFQWGWFADIVGVDQPGPIMSTMPIFMIGVVFGLAMDYEVFLVTRMREAYVHGESAHQAVVTGFRYSGRVVAAAALIMTSVFSGFVMEDNDFVRMVGLGLALAVLFDAFVVRMAIIPALFALLGDRAWWLPKWLDRILPDMDVEGGKLSRRLGAPPHPRPAQEPEYSR